jgi:hypothetical protein
MLRLLSAFIALASALRRRQISTVGIVFVSAASLSACAAPKGTATLLGGDCRLVPVQRYVVLGKTDYDQGWIDEVEVGAAAACPGRAKPQERPTELDDPKPPAVARRAAPPPPAKRRLFSRKPVAAGYVIPVPRVRQPPPAAPVVRTVEPTEPEPEPAAAPPPVQATKPPCAHALSFLC